MSVQKRSGHVSMRYSTGLSHLLSFTVRSSHPRLAPLVIPTPHVPLHAHTLLREPITAPLAQAKAYRKAHRDSSPMPSAFIGFTPHHGLRNLLGAPAIPDVSVQESEHQHRAAAPPQHVHPAYHQVRHMGFTRRRIWACLRMCSHALHPSSRANSSPRSQAGLTCRRALCSSRPGMPPSLFEKTPAARRSSPRATDRSRN